MMKSIKNWTFPLVIIPVGEWVVFTLIGEHERVEMIVSTVEATRLCKCMQLNEAFEAEGRGNFLGWIPHVGIQFGIGLYEIDGDEFVEAVTDLLKSGPRMSHFFGPTGRTVYVTETSRIKNFKLEVAIDLINDVIPVLDPDDLAILSRAMDIAKAKIERRNAICGTKGVSVELPSALEPELRGLVRVLQGVCAFRWVVAIYGDRHLRDTVIARALSELQLVPELVDATAIEDAAALVEVLKHRSQAGHPLFVIELRVLETNASTVFQALNVARETIAATCRVPVVLWLHDHHATALAREAPDLWSWRSGVFQFTQAIPDAGASGATKQGGGATMREVPISIRASTE